MMAQAWKEHFFFYHKCSDFILFPNRLKKMSTVNEKSFGKLELYILKVNLKP